MKTVILIICVLSSIDNVSEDDYYILQAWDLYYHVFRRIDKQLPSLTTLDLHVSTLLFLSLEFVFFCRVFPDQVSVVSFSLFLLSYSNVESWNLLCQELMLQVMQLLIEYSFQLCCLGNLYSVSYILEPPGPYMLIPFHRILIFNLISYFQIHQL